MRIVLIVDLSLSIGISVRSSIHRLPRLSFLGDALVKHQTVSHITMNSINTVEPVSSVERKRRQRVFRAWDKFQQQRTSSQQLLCTVGYSYRAVLRLVSCNIERIFLHLRICVLILLYNDCAFGLLRIYIVSL